MTFVNRAVAALAANSFVTVGSPSLATAAGRVARLSTFQWVVDWRHVRLESAFSTNVESLSSSQPGVIWW